MNDEGGNPFLKSISRDNEVVIEILGYKTESHR